MNLVIVRLMVKVGGVSSVVMKMEEDGWDIV